MKQSPVYRLWDKAVTAYEDLRGLNIGGAESGRRARAQAVGKYLRAQMPEAGAAISALQRDMAADPVRLQVMDEEKMLAQVKPLPSYMQKRGKWRKK